jgi:hypothetical protein
VLKLADASMLRSFSSSPNTVCVGGECHLFDVVSDVVKHIEHSVAEPELRSIFLEEYASLQSDLSIHSATKMLVDNILSQPAYCAMVPQKSFAGIDEFAGPAESSVKGILSALAQLLQTGTPDLLHHSSELLQAIFAYPYDWSPTALGSVEPSLLAILQSELYSLHPASILT